jgi:hypothetical protein
MTSEERQQVLEIFEAQFKASIGVRDAVFMKIKLARLAQKARAQLKAQRQQQQNQDPHAPPSPLSTDIASPDTASALAAAPVPSFANFHDPKSMREEAARAEKIRSGVALIEQRLSHLRLEQCAMRDDGSCCFRSIAHQVFGDADRHHAHVRRVVVQHMKQHSDDFSFLFDGEAEFQRYLESMSQLGTWGDELTLRAASDALRCTIHVLTSEKDHFYICYRPAASEVASRPPPLNIFLAYLSPIHYNSIVVRR